MTEKTTAQKLEDLFRLYKEGTISKQEYETLKAKLLGNKPPVKKIREKKPASEPDTGNQSSKSADFAGDKNEKSQSEKKKSSVPIIIIASVSTIAAVILLVLFVIPSNKTSMDMPPEMQNEAPSHTTEDTREELLIIGDNIWVRDAPSTGAVVMKLSDGTRCQLLEKGKFEEIRDMYDYWYRISVDGKEGWVFGSQTNLMTGYTRSDAISEGLVSAPVEARRNIDALTSKFIDFFKAYNENSYDLNYFLNSGPGLMVMHNPGAMCYGRMIDEPEFKDFDISYNKVFKFIPEGGHCMGYPDTGDGFYYEPVAEANLPAYTDDGMTVKEYRLRGIYGDYEIYKVCIIKDDWWVSDFYFVKKGSDLYLIIQDFCDCSA